MTDAIRRAVSAEAETLTALAMRSKASHGYDADFMRRVAPLLRLRPDDILASEVWVYERDAAIVGFYRLRRTVEGDELDDLWVDAPSIGQGVGAMLFAHAVERASACGWPSFSIESDPGAERFYLRMGATRVGSRRSGAGRMLPLLRYDLGLART